MGKDRHDRPAGPESVVQTLFAIHMDVTVLEHPVTDRELGEGPADIRPELIHRRLAGGRIIGEFRPEMGEGRHRPSVDRSDWPLAEKRRKPRADLRAGPRRQHGEEVVQRLVAEP
jgi:hypothetical protein